NADAPGSGVSAATQLITRSFSLSGYTSANLSFRHFYRHLAPSAAYVEVSVNGGGTWTTLATYNTADVGTTSNFATANISLAGQLGNTDVRLRFRFEGGWVWGWAI